VLFIWFDCAPIYMPLFSNESFGCMVEPFLGGGIMYTADVIIFKVDNGWVVEADDQTIAFTSIDDLCVALQFYFVAGELVEPDRGAKLRKIEQNDLRKIQKDETTP